MTTLEEVADYRNKLKDLSITLTEFDNSVNLKIHLPNESLIKALSFKMKSKPAKIIIKNNYDLREVNGIYYFSFDAKNGDNVSLSF